MDPTRVWLWIWGVIPRSNSPSLDKGVLKVGAIPPTREQRNALGVIAIQVDDLLISGGDFL